MANTNREQDLLLLESVASGREPAEIRADALVGLARAKDAKRALACIVHVAREDSASEMRALAVQLGVEDIPTLTAIAETVADPAVRAAALRRLVAPQARPILVKTLADPDPFIGQAARAALARSTNLEARLQLAESENAAVRLAAIALLRKSEDPAARAPLTRLLADPDASVRFAAVQWVAEAGLGDYREQISAGLAHGATTRSLFEAYLAALEKLDGQERKVKDEWSGEQYVLSLIENPDTAPAVRARALRTLRADHPALTIALLTRLEAAPDLPTRLEAVRSLRERQEPEARGQVERIAADAAAPAELRAEAILGITGDSADRRRLLLDLASDGDPVLRREALRSLRGAPLSDADRERLAALRDQERDREMIDRLLGAEAPARPPQVATDDWAALVGAGGNAAAGQRVFFHPRGPACYRCHQMDGRGGSIGPELSVTPRALTVGRLLESLLKPSKEIAPQFTSWAVVRHDGTTFSGIMLSEAPDGTRQYGTPDGQTITVRDADVAEVRPQPKSIMPDDLCTQMTPAELADLLAYLRATK